MDGRKGWCQPHNTSKIDQLTYAMECSTLFWVKLSKVLTDHHGCRQIILCGHQDYRKLIPLLTNQTFINSRAHTIAPNNLLCLSLYD